MALAPTSLIGWNATAARLTVTVPKGTPAGSYSIGVRGTNQGRNVVLNLPVTVVSDDPTATIPYGAIQVGVATGHSWANVRVLWPAATDPTSPIAGYELQRSQDGGPWGATIARTGKPARDGHRAAFRQDLSVPRPGGRSRRELESMGVDPELDPPPRV